jgi:hypothetical protein
MTLFRLLAIFAIASATAFVRPAAAQSVEINNAQPAATPYRTGSLTRPVPLFLKNIDGRWSAGLSGDIKDPHTERIEVSPLNKSTRVLTDPPPGGRRQCLTKMKDRSEFGYLECNSAFFSVNTGSAAAGTLIRGVLSLGILTAADAASGNTAFTVSLDQAALDAAVSESNALDLAKASAPLFEYRDLFAKARSSQQLRNFIATFENGFDPESLVSKAKDKLPTAIALEETQVRQKAAAAAQQAKVFRQQQIQRQAEEEAVSAFRARLKLGDRVAMNCKDFRGCQLIGMVVEMKQPLAYVQWENATPTMQWVRLESLLPPR